MTAKPLRQHQRQGIDDIRDALRRSRRVLYQLSTGGGKTRIMAEIATRLLIAGKRVLILAPRRELVHQIHAEVTLHGGRIGIIMAGENQVMFLRGYVASVDTLQERAINRRSMDLPDCDYVIVDEGHIFASDEREALLARYSTQRHIIFTATPARGDGKGLAAIADELVPGPTMRELIEDGYLLPLRYFAPSEPDLKKVKLTADGDYSESALAKVMDKPKLIGDIVDNWQRLASDRSTVVFCVKRSHARHICEEFLSRGIAAEYLDGETPKKERADILARVDSGETQVLCNVFVATYGLDIPRLSCAVVARPTKNITLYLQMLGRIMRPFEEQKDGLVIDHAGAVKENGYADEDHPWSLDGSESVKDRIKQQKQEQKAAREIVCVACGCCFKGSRHCPTCGAEVIPITEEIPVHSADLVEMVRKSKDETTSSHRNRTTPNDTKKRIFGEMLHYANEKGKAPGWAAHTYRSMFGVWPNAHKDAVPVPTSPEIMSYIRSRNIAYSRRR